MSTDATETSNSSRASPLSLIALANVPIMSESVQRWRYGSMKFGNPHTKTIRNITDHVHRTPLMYPAHVTIRPITITAREAKPAGAKQSNARYNWGPNSQGPLSNKVTASHHVAGASIRRATVKRTLETATVSRRILKFPRWFCTRTYQSKGSSRRFALVPSSQGRDHGA